MKKLYFILLALCFNPGLSVNKKAIDDAIFSLVNLLRENKKNAMEKVNVLEQEMYGQRAFDNALGRNENFQFLLWEIFFREITKGKIDNETARIPSYEEIFGRKPKKPSKETIEKFSNDNGDFNNFFNTYQKFLTINSQEKAELDITLSGYEQKDLHSFIVAFNYNMREYFKHYGLNDDMAQIATYIFYKNLEDEGGESVEINFKEIFKIANYVLQEMIKLQDDTQLSIQRSQSIKDEIAIQFARYRRIALNKGPEKALEIFKENLDNKKFFISDDGIKVYIEKFENEINNNGEIIEPMKLICITFLISALSSEGKKVNNLYELNEFLINLGQILSKLYSISYHEGAHAFIASEKFVFGRTIAKDNTGGKIYHEESKGPYERIRVASAGSLGTYFVRKKIRKNSAHSDFRTIISVIKNLNDNINNSNIYNEVLKEKLQGFQREGEKNLKNCEALGNPTLDDFLTPSLKSQLEKQSKNSEELNQQRGLISGIILEVLGELSNNKKYQELSEIFFDKKIVEKDIFNKVTQEGKGRQLLLESQIEESENSDDEAHNGYIDFSAHKKELLLLDNKTTVPIKYASDIEEFIALVKKETKERKKKK